MQKTIGLLVIGLVFGTGFGFLLAASSGLMMRDGAVHDHSAHDHGDGTRAAHDQMTEAGDPAPTLTLTLHADGPQSRNLHIRVTDFIFAPEAVNSPHVLGQGHAHVYVNGIKIARAYALWVQLAARPKDTHLIRVTLNANDHTQLARGGAPLEATAQVTIE